MDAKALAKSKRAHSQHHSKKSHASPASKAPAVAASAGNSKKPSAKQTREKNRQFRGSSTALPSNWDRYEEEYDSGSEDPSLGGTSRTSDVVVPKSKGADFRYLISEAQSQLQSPSDLSLESFDSFGGFLPGFNQGVSTVLSARGKNILSWIGNDNFAVEDNETASQASFLSMDLHALAEQLAKVDVSQRLFIDAYLLPPEMHSEGLQKSKCQDYDHTEATHESEADDHYLDKMEFHGSANGEDIMGNRPDISPATTENVHSVPALLPEGSMLVNLAKGGDSTQVGQTCPTKFMNSMEQPNRSSSVDLKENKPSRFEAAAAEAELDMLLDSFGETKLFYSGFPVVKQEPSHVSSQQQVSGFPQPSVQAPDASKNASGAFDLDNAIDELRETSNPTNQNNAMRDQQEKAVRRNPPSDSSLASAHKSSDKS
ncbi:PREDICTED: uncharacterized protein LOC104599483 isoform X2 [Nelumbo nucifera]|uniref:Uncharacterized protein LOC104599483 isoform X2 n=2 Tax=Nelumbo nucifera TaxID=4432 RepID=A0A1U8A298_NELNU|nr:PREDICTED: uncharacterized protein LOC104599483 isoform X2 [Nelumbo nucifera]DAD22774.1 TPA_asm: hypothetical protein HUJ06_024237 [Nelumbo nucifera]